MELFSEGTELTPIANMILNEDIPRLRKELQNGWKINGEIEICKFIHKLPIIFALYYNKLKVVEFLIDNGAELNLPEKPVIPAAADNCSLDTIKMLLVHGADLNAVDNVGSNAIDRALINERFDIMLDLINLGMDVKKDGAILRSAVFSRQYRAIQILLDQNINVNKHSPDMVFPYNPSAVHVAAENNDFETVKLLVKHGADVTIKDSYGSRPFIAAKENNNSDMMEYLKALEPEEWHNEEQKLLSLKKYMLPAKLIKFFRSKDLEISIKSQYLSYVVFNSLVNCKEVKWRGHKFLDLLCDADTYSHEGFLVWYPKGSCLAHADYEHEELRTLGKWDDFMSNPSEMIEKIFEQC